MAYTVLLEASLNDGNHCAARARPSVPMDQPINHCKERRINDTRWRVTPSLNTSTKIGKIMPEPKSIFRKADYVSSQSVVYY